MKRQPAVAGQFYPLQFTGLNEQVAGFTISEKTRKHAIGIVSPHAGLMYSGAVAGAVYSQILMPHTVILLGPNHTGMGAPVSVMSEGTWQMPTGESHIDTELAGAILDGCTAASKDTAAHLMEHSLEVQLPFIIYHNPDVKIVPIMLGIDSLEVCRSLGEVIAQAVQTADYPVTLVASSDMSHFISDAAAREKDAKAIDRVLALDPEGLYETVRTEDISMCGVLPVTTMLFASKILGAKCAELIKYTTSAEVSGDYSQVVGYAGMIIN